MTDKDEKGLPATLPPLDPAEGKRKSRARKAAEAPPPQVDVKMVESAWQGLWVVLRFVLGFAGLESDAKVLPADEAREDARALLPVVQRHPAIARVLSWIGAPVVIAQRVMQHFHAKRKEKANNAGTARPAPAPPA